MYLSDITIKNFRQFGDGDAALHIAFNSGITALVGRNDTGKSAVIDAIRYALLTRDTSHRHWTMQPRPRDSTRSLLLPSCPATSSTRLDTFGLPRLHRVRQSQTTMPEDLSLIPEITDEDIDWVRNLMGLGVFDAPRRAFLVARTTLDVSACPGSGKTTLIVAKLAILARKWPHRTKGICVLSHTNVAREEIQRRLGDTVFGQRLLGYPHFIDTIHGFVNRFLALPWLNSNGYAVLRSVSSAGNQRWAGMSGAYGDVGNSGCNAIWFRLG